MRTKLFLPLAAAFALAACGGDADDVGEGVSVEDALAEAEASGMMPRPGKYRSTQELIEFDLAGVPAEQMNLVRQAFALDAAEASTYCISEQMTREQWYSEMTESDCTISRLDTSGGEIDIAMSCAAQGGISGEMTMKGTSGEDSSNMEISFSQPIPGMGEVAIRMRVKSERIGDCT